MSHVWLGKECSGMGVVVHTSNPIYLGGRDHEDPRRGLPEKVRTTSQQISRMWWCISVMLAKREA
jgi:hypothetical protein